MIRSCHKAAKLVLKKTDFATTPPVLDLIDAQTNAGHTALHFSFAYGYAELGQYLAGPDTSLFFGLTSASQSVEER